MKSKGHNIILCLIMFTIALPGLAVTDSGTTSDRLVKIVIEDDKGSYHKASKKELESIQIIRKKNSIPVKTGMRLRIGDEIKTGIKSNLVLYLRRNVVNIGPDAHIKITQMNPYNIYIFKGALHSNVNDNEYKIDTEYVGAHVKGTKFYIAVSSGKKEPDVIVDQGQVDLKFKLEGHNPVTLNSFQGYLDGKIFGDMTKSDKIWKDHGKFKSSVDPSKRMSQDIYSATSITYSYGNEAELANRINLVNQWIKKVERASEPFKSPKTQARSSKTQVRQSQALTESRDVEDRPLKTLSIPRQTQTYKLHSAGKIKYLSLKEFGISFGANSLYSKEKIGKSYKGKVSDPVKANLIFKSAYKGGKMNAFYLENGEVRVIIMATGETILIDIKETVW